METKEKGKPQLQPLATIREDQKEGRKRQSAGGKDRKAGCWPFLCLAKLFSESLGQGNPFTSLQLHSELAEP